jgi:cephalosporin-C deacetylase
VGTIADMSDTALEQTRAEVKRPADFDAFWQGVRAELADVPLEWERLPGAALATAPITETRRAGGETATHRIDWLRFSSLDDRLVYGWLAVPKDLPKDQPTPGSRGYLWLPGYSLGSPPPGPEALYPDTLTLGLNLHGNTPDAPYAHPSLSGADYITQGIESPQTYVYRAIVAHCLRALDVLARQTEVGPDRLMVGGMSQGGGLALVTAALSPQVRLCLADMPWLGALDLALSLLDRPKYKRMKTGRYPDARGLIADYAEAHPERAAQVYQTYRYFDPLSHAGSITCPTQVSAGGRDPSCKPPTVYALYNELRCEKEMLYLPQTGHEIVPAMHEAHLNWVQRV